MSKSLGNGCFGKDAESGTRLPRARGARVFMRVVAGASFQREAGCKVRCQ